MYKESGGGRLNLDGQACRGSVGNQPTVSLGLINNRRTYEKKDPHYEQDTDVSALQEMPQGITTR